MPAIRLPALRRPARSSRRADPRSIRPATTPRFAENGILWGVSHVYPLRLHYSSPALIRASCDGCGCGAAPEPGFRAGVVRPFVRGLRPAPRAEPAPISAEPAGPRPFTGERSERPFVGSGQPVALYVRLCDGRFFPIQHNTGAPAPQTCNALCPASQTKIFSGMGIDTAVAADGTRYSGLHNAFLYRHRLVQGCTCNGKDNFGLASLSANPDPTVRAGDIIATQNGLTMVSRTNPRPSATSIANVTVGH